MEHCFQATSKQLKDIRTIILVGMKILDKEEVEQEEACKYIQEIITDGIIIDGVSHSGSDILEYYDDTNVNVNNNNNKNLIEMDEHNNEILNDIIEHHYEINKDSEEYNYTSEEYECEHQYIQDLIDIDPDRAQLIEYCNKCFHVRF